MARDEKNTAIYVAFDEVEPHDTALPEKNLLRAILLTAMADLKKPGEPSRRALEYFLSPDDEYIFSFHSVCNLLDLDADRILIVSGLRKSALEQIQHANGFHRNGKTPDADDEAFVEALRSSLLAVE